MRKTTSVKIASDLVKELDDYANVAQLVEQSQSPVTRSLKLAAGFGAAASIGLMTFDQAAADIIYSGPQNISLSLAGQDRYFFTNTTIDIDFDSQVDFFFGAAYLGVFSVDWPDSGNVITTLTGSGTPGPRKLPHNYLVSSGRFDDYGGSFFPAYFGGAFVLINPIDPWDVQGNPSFTRTGFMGFQINGDQFGWMRIRLETGSNGWIETLTIVDWAYESINGKPILTPAIPEPGAGTTLGLLAMGAVGLRRVRKKQVK